MVQEIIIVLIFIAAVAFLARTIVRHFSMKEECSSGCGKCGVDFSKIEKQILDKKSS